MSCVCVVSVCCDGRVLGDDVMINGDSEYMII